MLRPMAIAIVLAVCSLSGSSSAYAQASFWGRAATKTFVYPAFSAMQRTFPDAGKSIATHLPFNNSQLGGRQLGLGREPQATTISEKVMPW